jgi:hypothetical protein
VKPKITLLRNFHGNEKSHYSREKISFKQGNLGEGSTPESRYSLVLNVVRVLTWGLQGLSVLGRSFVWERLAREHMVCQRVLEGLFLLRVCNT